MFYYFIRKNALSGESNAEARCAGSEIFRNRIDNYAFFVKKIGGFLQNVGGQQRFNIVKRAEKCVLDRYFDKSVFFGYYIGGNRRKTFGDVFFVFEMEVIEAEIVEIQRACN